MHPVWLERIAFAPQGGSTPAIVTDARDDQVFYVPKYAYAANASGFSCTVSLDANGDYSIRRTTSGLPWRQKYRMLRRVQDNPGTYVKLSWRGAAQTGSSTPAPSQPKTPVRPCRSTLSGEA